MSIGDMFGEEKKKMQSKNKGREYSPGIKEINEGYLLKCF